MRRLLVLSLFLSALELVSGAPGPTSGTDKDTLSQLSRAGERYVEEELKRALLGVKQMKERMEKAEEEHEQLMQTLRHSRDKRRGAEQLATEAEQKLQEAERQCHDRLKTSWEECRPCLGDTCRMFYTSTCHKGFSFKMEEFFRKMSSLLENQDRFYNQGPADQDQVHPRNQEAPAQRSPEGADQELVRADACFSRLQGTVGSLHNRSAALVDRMQQELGRTFLVAFSTGQRPRRLGPTEEGLGFLRGMGLDRVLDSVFDFGRGVMEEVSSAIAGAFGDEQQLQSDSPRWDPAQSNHLCRNLRRQASECWQLHSLCESCQWSVLKECPNVKEQHTQLDEISLLLNASREQYEEVLLLVQEHNNNTLGWLSDMLSRFGWVTRVANRTAGPRSVFRVAAVVRRREPSGSGLKAGSTVEVRLLEAPPVAISVPAELEVHEPTFIQYVAQEALALYIKTTETEDDLKK